jgi:hypothetical protein
VKQSAHGGAPGRGRFARAGIEAQLHVRDRLWHSFFSDPDLPELRQAHRTVVAFFERHLAPPQEEAHP